MVYRYTPCNPCCAPDDPACADICPMLSQQHTWTVPLEITLPSQDGDEGCTFDDTYTLAYSGPCGWNCNALPDICPQTPPEAEHPVNSPRFQALTMGLDEDGFTLVVTVEHRPGGTIGGPHHYAGFIRYRAEFPDVDCEGPLVLPFQRIDMVSGTFPGGVSYPASVTVTLVEP